MVRVLVIAEFRGDWHGSAACTMCASEGRKHEYGCLLDAALTAAGLPDQASRNKLRELIRARSK